MQTALSNLRTTPAPCSTHRAAFRAPSQGHRLRACNSGFRTFGPYGQGSPLMGMFGLNTNDRRVQEVFREFERAMRASGQTCQPAQQRQSSQSDGSMRLSIDWVETDDRYTLYADVPGLQKSDLKIQVNQQERKLTISGERGEPQVAGPGSEANDSRKQLERSFGKFSRSLTLPKDADLEGISARVDKGVLSLKVFKTIADSKSVQDIEIE